MENVFKQAAKRRTNAILVSLYTLVLRNEIYP